MFQTMCAGCDFPIEPGDRWVEAMSKNFHAECFNCSVSHSSSTTSHAHTQTCMHVHTDTRTHTHTSTCTHTHTHTSKHTHTYTCAHMHACARTHTQTQTRVQRPAWHSFTTFYTTVRSSQVWSGAAAYFVFWSGRGTGLNVCMYSFMGMEAQLDLWHKARRSLGGWKSKKRKRSLPSCLLP